MEKFEQKFIAATNLKVCRPTLMVYALYQLLHKLKISLLHSVGCFLENAFLENTYIITVYFYAGLPINGT